MRCVVSVLGKEALEMMSWMNADEVEAGKE